ncbi:cytochrome c oxidase subunit II [Saccharospirillum mangrovi]|uniref:cytochrome c oxidase subunit II n=1 Tax=Saccharospirillum mangrovi TaxID=2161747 RepID=UPI000D3AA69F|nr:cytochrome c oxidase subunit II [Saccharospirillum mangrovi]
MQRRLLRAGAILAALLVGSAAQADWEFNMPKGVTDISQEVYGLHMLIFWVCVIIGIAVFGVMFYAMFKHRKSKGAVSANFHESTKVELAWTLIPAVVIFAVGVKATFTLADMYNVDNADMTVEVTGYQWRWRYRYINEADPDAEVDYFSSLATSRDEINNRLAKNENYLLEVDQPLVLPVGQKVRFILTASDVIHSWWVPDLAVKKDAIPGMANEAWTIINEPGTYRGQCTELCGRDHGFMPIVVEAVTQAEFDEWLAGKQEEARQVAELTNQEWTVEQLVERGRGVYQSACAACHQPNGSGIPGTFPALTGSPIATGDIQEHINVVFHGRPGTAMQAFGNQLSPVDLAAVVTFERNALGNSVGDMVEPIDILNLSAGE